MQIKVGSSPFKLCRLKPLCHPARFLVTPSRARGSPEDPSLRATAHFTDRRTQALLTQRNKHVE